MTDGYGWDGGVRYQGFAGLAWVGVELSGNIISNYRTFKCERSERTYNFDYVRRKRRDQNEINNNEMSNGIVRYGFMLSNSVLILSKKRSCCITM